MITHANVLHLLLDHYHDGRFLNGHPEIAEWLSQSGICYIEQLPDELERLSYNNVRVWSSKAECDKRKAESLETAQEFYKRYAEPAPRKPRERHPLEDELETLCKTATSTHDFAKIVSIKSELRKLGIAVNHNKTSIRKLSGL